MELNKQKKKKDQTSATGDIKVPRKLYEQLNKTYRFKRRGPATTISQVAAADTLGALQFTLSVVNGYTELTTLFDAYRVDYVEVQFKPVYNMAAVSAVANIIMPQLYTVIDLDDATTPASLGAMNERATLKTVNFDKQVTRAFPPKHAKALYSGTFASYGMADGWIDCNSPTVQYYGIQYGIEAGAGGQTALQSWKITFVYYLSFRYVR